jgi:MFS family permease
MRLAARVPARRVRAAAVVDEATPPRLKAIAAISSIGTAQLIAWGSLYYAIAVMGGAMRRELGLSEPQLFAAFTSSLALSGLLAPWAGSLVDRHGGRVVLSAGMSLGALGFATLASVHDLRLSLLALALQGVAMSLSLYDTCFAALAQQYPGNYRRTVTFVTLVAGLASSVFWPATHYLISSVGWRTTCWIFSFLLMASAAMNVLAFTAPPARVHASPDTIAKPTEVVPARARWLICAFAAASFVQASLSAHLPAALRDLQFRDELAVWIASSVGVMQVLGRAVEFSAGASLSVRRLGFLTIAGLFASLLVLLASEGAPLLAVAFSIVYGAANGVNTVVRAVLPRELFGTRQLGAVLGRFAAPSLATRALAPFAFSVVASPFGMRGALVCTLLVAALSLATYLVAVPLNEA